MSAGPHMPNMTKYSPIDLESPPTWHALQESVAAILRESGVEAEVEKTIPTARGQVTVDVFAHDADATPSQTYFVECKQWRSRVPQTVIHAFQTVVGNAGANWGAIVSASGFQSGAISAAKYSNVRLLTWPGFQSLFAPKWFEIFFTKTVFDIVAPLIEYTEPINSRIFNKADALPQCDRNRFVELRRRHAGLAGLCTALSFLGLRAPTFVSRKHIEPFDLPLRNRLSSLATPEVTPLSSVLDAESYRTLIAELKTVVDAAVAEFDGVFREPA